jgi:hypothetical protein
MLDPKTYGSLLNLKDFVRRGTECGPLWKRADAVRMVVLNFGMPAR